MIIIRHSYLIGVQSIGLFFIHYPRKNWVNVLLLKQNFPCRNKPIQLIITCIGLTNPRAQEVIDKCVESMESDDINEKSPSAWGSPVCIVAKADGSPRFCVDYRNTTYKFFIRETWPMPDIESHIDTIDGVEFITVCDVQSAYWQIPIAKKDCHQTAFVTSKGIYVLKVLPFGIANAPWVFQRLMSLAFANFGQRRDLLVYMDDFIAKVPLR